MWKELRSSEEMLCRGEGLGCLVVVLQVLILDMELQAHSSATGGVEI